MYLPNTVGKWHKKRSNSFSAIEIYGFEIALSFPVHRNRWWRKWRSKVNVLKIEAIKGKPTRLLPHAKMLLVPIKFFFLCWVDYALEGSTFSLSKCDFSGDFGRIRFHTERAWHISIYCGYCFWSAGFALWCKGIFFDLFGSVKLLITAE